MMFRVVVVVILLYIEDCVDLKGEMFRVSSYYVLC